MVAANGGEDTGIQEALKKGGFKADGKTFKAHLDGYNQMDLLTGKGPGARDEIFYFDAGGDLNAVRYKDWKVTFTDMSGNLSTAWKKSPGWPYITNLRRNPYERFYGEAGMYLRWLGSRMFLMGPAQDLVKSQLESLKEFPPARGSNLSLGKVFNQIQFARPGQ